MTKIGFTGTQKGMTEAQQATLSYLLHNSRGVEFHHGDCIGADAQAHDIAVSLGLELFSHPPVIGTKRAWKAANHIAEPLPYQNRNAAIVKVADFLIAAPAEFTEKLRSGTWSTIRRAQRANKRVCLIYPDGTLG